MPRAPEVARSKLLQCFEPLHRLRDVLFHLGLKTQVKPFGEVSSPTFAELEDIEGAVIATAAQNEAKELSAAPPIH